MSIDRIALREAIEKHFNKAELRTLCFDLNIDYENLEGNSKQSKVQELISLCERLNKKSELLETVLRLRPTLRETNFDDSSDSALIPTVPENKIEDTSKNVTSTPKVNDKEIAAIKDWLLSRFANLVSGQVLYIEGIVSSSMPSRFNSFSFILEGRKTHYDSIGVIIRRFHAPSPSQHTRLWNIIKTIPNPQHVGLKRIVFIILSDYDYRFNLENLDHYEPGIDIILGSIISHFSGGGHFEMRKKASTG